MKSNGLQLQCEVQHIKHDRLQLRCFNSRLVYRDLWDVILVDISFFPPKFSSTLWKRSKYCFKWRWFFMHPVADDLQEMFQIQCATQVWSSAPGRIPNLSNPNDCLETTWNYLKLLWICASICLEVVATLRASSRPCAAACQSHLQFQQKYHVFIDGSSLAKPSP